MNTKIKKERKNQTPRTRQEHGQKKQGKNATVHHEQELPETRMTD